MEYFSGDPLNGLYVELLDEEGKEIDSTMSLENGEAKFYNLQLNDIYTVKVGSPNNFTTGMYLTEKKFTYTSSTQSILVQTNAVDHNKGFGVPVILQTPELPHGCEITTLTAVLNYYGAETSKLEMDQNYLPKQSFEYKLKKKYGPNPNQAYGGEPSNLETGTYVFAEPIVEAANNFINERKFDLQAKNISGSTIEDITNYIRQGIPVITWVTLDLSPPKVKGGWVIKETGEYHQMYQNLHTMVLLSVNNNTVEVMDPLKGIIILDKRAFFNSYEAMGEQAVVVY
ncbi:hypothetical protein EP18_10925 [Lysinibacillus sphaericus]|nr:C39 family peptidase [Lysinibacillus sphaericus]KEK11663.1 hypothetical protein EP18_10925 [Lysinibacillus sphaericus]